MTDYAQPATAYESLDAIEKCEVDSYLLHVEKDQARLNERIIHAIYKPIPLEFVRRSRGILTKPMVLAAIAQRIQERADEEDLSPARVIREHAAIAFSNIADFLHVDAYGFMQVLDMEKIDAEKMKSVKTFKCKMTPRGYESEIVMHDKIQSLKILGEMMGLVIPDRPPVLKEYSKPPEQKAIEHDGNAGKKYAALLEELKAGE